MHALVDKKMDDYIVVHRSKDTEEEGWNIIDFKERKIVVGEYVDLIYRLGVKADSIGKFDLSSFVMALMQQYLHFPSSSL